MAGCAQHKTPNQLWDEGMAQTKEEHYDQAEETFKEILDKESIPDTLRAKTNFTLADLYLNHFKRYDDAEQKYRMIVEKYPATKWGAKSQFMIGYMYANYVNNYEKAKKEYRRFIDLYPTDQLVSAVDFEMNHLGKSLDDLDFLPSADSSNGAETATTGTQVQ